jgi:lipopolysaccharide biosynthesis regulator YciM
MEFEFWWLLAFPLFFGLGWIAARIDIKHLLSESRALPASYFKGLNFLINEQPDKAIEAFLEVARADQQTTELHFTLGGLFRRRGEVDRAIRMHQALIDRQDLSVEQRQAALFELGQDYHKAGMLDRAEQLFSKLSESEHAGQALRFLLEIYVTEKDWPKAVETAKALERRSSEPLNKEIANYYCELAAGEYAHSRPNEAHEYLDKALQENRKCVRAHVMLGDWAAKEGQHTEAVEQWKKVEGQNPAYLFLVADRLLQSYRTLGRAQEGLTLLRGFQERYPAMGLLDAAFQATLEGEGAQSAYRLAREELRRNPTLPGLDKFLEAQLLEATDERRGDVQLVKNLVQSHSARFAYYQCVQCGFKARQFYWHCPACGNWESFPPRRHAEREPSALQLS